MSRLKFTLNFFCCVSAFSFVDALNKESTLKFQAFSNALECLLEEYYIKNSIGFDVAILDKSSESFSFDVLTKILTKNKNILTLKVLNFNKYQKKKMLIVSRSIIIFAINIKVLTTGTLDSKVKLARRYSKQLQIFLVCINSDERSMENLYFNSSIKFDPANPSDVLEIKTSIHTSVITQDVVNQKISLFSFAYLTGPNCSHKLIKVNEFSTKLQKWITGRFGPNKLLSFYDCHLKILTTTSPFDGTGLSPYYKQLMDSTAAKFNFRYSFLHIENESDFHTIIALDRPMVTAMDNKNLAECFEYFHFFEVFFTLIVSTGETYTPLEKLFLPLDRETWILVSLFYFCGIVVILFVKTCRGELLKDLIFGTNVRTPIFNMIMAIFGQSQTILPTKSFARYLLMMFIIFSMIIRTGYQGVQFEIMFKVIQFSFCV